MKLVFTKMYLGGKLSAHILLPFADLFPVKCRRLIWRLYGIRIGKNVSIGTKIHVSNPRKLRIGDNSHIGYNTFFFFGGGGKAIIKIGKNVWFAPRVSVCTVSHFVGDEAKRASTSIHESVTIEDRCWIGMNATILPGVTIARGCVIGASALVNKSTEPNGLYVGGSC